MSIYGFFLLFVCFFFRVLSSSVLFFFIFFWGHTHAHRTGALVCTRNEPFCTEGCTPVAVAGTAREGSRVGGHARACAENRCASVHKRHKMRALPALVLCLLCTEGGVRACDGGGAWVEGAEVAPGHALCCVVTAWARACTLVLRVWAIFVLPAELNKMEQTRMRSCKQFGFVVVVTRKEIRTY
jgi:hypothetical protein